MFVRVCCYLISVAGVASAGFAADFPKPKAATASQKVPGANVTIEGGVRVIRPLPGDGDWGMEQAQSTGRLIYRGAAFYRVPTAGKKAKASQGDPKVDPKPEAQ
jgi:hypothetical protein